jgi:putative protease
VNDTLHIKGHSTDLELTVDSIQIEHESVTEAKQGDGIGLKVPERVRRKDRVYKIIE